MLSAGESARSKTPPSASACNKTVTSASVRERVGAPKSATPSKPSTPTDLRISISSSSSSSYPTMSPPLLDAYAPLSVTVRAALRRRMRFFFLDGVETSTAVVDCLNAAPSPSTRSSRCVTLIEAARLRGAKARMTMNKLESTKSTGTRYTLLVSSAHNAESVTKKPLPVSERNPSQEDWHDGFVSAHTCIHAPAPLAAHQTQRNERAPRRRSLESARTPSLTRLASSRLSCPVPC